MSAIKASRTYRLSFLELNMIITATPKAWIKELKEQSKSVHLPMAPTKYDLAINNKKLAAKIYNQINNKEEILMPKKLEWQKALNINITYDTFIMGTKKIYSVTNVPKLRSFQFRIMQRSIVTNVLLYKWGLKDSPECAFCECEEETTIHLFARCLRVQVIWQKLADLCEEEIILGTGITNNKLVKSLLIVTKFYLYRQKCLGKSINFMDLRGYILHIENIEKYLAIKNDQLDKHEKKWGIDSQ